MVQKLSKRSAPRPELSVPSAAISNGSAQKEITSTRFVKWTLIYKYPQIRYQKRYHAIQPDDKAVELRVGCK
jgi:hypothetical protein